MIVKQLNFKDDARQRLISGIKKMAGAVKCTLGARGKTVLIESENVIGGITVTKDGVTVARSIYLEDPIENAAVILLRQAAENTAKNAGDGPQDLDSKILTPNGWIRMGDIKIGMDICGTNGSIQKVEGVYEKGLKEKVKVYFSGGGDVTCCIDHLWTVTTSYGVKKTIPLTEILSDYTSKNSDGTNSYKYFVQTTAVEFIENKDLMPLDPYFLGVLLGDGSLSSTNRSTIEISIGKHKEHIINKLILPKGVDMRVTWVEKKNYFRIKLTGVDKSGKSIIKTILKSLNLLGVTSHTKFIPNSYLFSSISSRTKLLQGLIDTDGYINERGLFEFSSINEELANNFADLCRSLGKQISVREKNRSNSNGYSKNSTFHVEERKGYKYGNKIINIVKTNELTEMQCIKVSNPDHLYITDGYTVTHNTSTSIVLTEELVLSATEMIKDEHNSSEVIRCLQKYKDDVVEYLDKISVKVSKAKLFDIATISSNGDKEIGRLIAKTYSEVGKNGVVLVENSTGNDTYSDIIDGMRIQRGWTSKYFVNDEKRNECILTDAYVLVTDQEVTNLMSLEHIFAECIKKNKPLLIIGELSSNALATLNMNVIRKTIKACNILPPHFGYKRKDLLSDLAIALGAKFFSEGTGDDLQLIRLEDLGRVKKAVIGQESTSLVNYESEEVDKLLSDLKDRLAETSKKSEVEFLKERIANVTGSIGIIHVGADSDIELKEKRDRIDDAVCAVQAAIEDGILPGGGVALLKSIEAIKKIEGKNGEVAYDIMCSVLESPIRQIVLNAGLDADSIVKELYFEDDINRGYDVKLEKYCNMIESGIIDPCKVTKQAIINSVSVATTIMSTDATVTNVRQ